jgi:hypothetical protein
MALTENIPAGQFLRKADKLVHALVDTVLCYLSYVQYHPLPPHHRNFLVSVVPFCTVKNT